jgi:hypothetical protein
MAVTQHDAANTQAKLKSLEAITQTLRAATTAKEKVSSKVDLTNSELQRLQDKAVEVDSSNQGKMKKLQRKAKILMDKIKNLEQLQGQLEAAVNMLLRRKLDYLIVYKIATRARMVDGELYLQDEADAVVMNAIHMRRHSETFDLERVDMLLKALPKEFKE